MFADDDEKGYFFTTPQFLARIYFKYYLHQALIKARLGNDYLKWLDRWKENIQLALTTWAETSDVAKT